MDKMCGIYCIENISNSKKYIGQSIDIKARFNKHKSLLRNNKHNNVHLQSSWNLYGENNFKFYILKACGIEKLDEYEKYYIKVFKVMDANFGYNIEPGGNAHRNMSEKTKQKISESLKGRIFTEEHCQKISDANRVRKITDEMRRHMSENHADVSGENNPNYGKHMTDDIKKKMIANRNTPKGENHINFGKTFSDEVKAKMRENHADFSGPKHPRCRPIYCPELDREFWGAKEVECEFGIRAADIAACLNGRQKSAGKHPITSEKLHWVDANEKTLAS